MSASYNVLKTYPAALILGYFSLLYAITSLQNHALQNAPPFASYPQPLGWSDNTRNREVTGSVSLNPGKKQEIERNKQAT